MSKKAVLDKKWTDIEKLCNEFGLDLTSMADLIEDKQIQTRGRSYDEINQADQTKIKLHEIPKDFWQEALIEETPKVFLFIFREYGFQNHPRDIRVGYIDIQVDKADFERKVKIRGANLKKRQHKQILAFKEIYDECAQGKDWLSPNDLLEYILDEYDNNSGDSERIEKLAIMDHKMHGEDNRKSQFSYCLNNGPMQDISYGRFFNIISQFNKERSN